MSFGVLLIASALLAKAELMLGPSDYPVEALRSKRSAGAIVDALVDPKGRIVSCETPKTFGDATLASQMCSLLKNKRHKPATDNTGKPAYGWILELNTMWVPDTKAGDAISAMKWTATVPLKLSQTPAQFQGGPIKVVYQVASDGQPVDCGAGNHETRADMVSLVCSALKPKFGVKTDKDGQPVGYITQISVDLSADLAPTPPTQQ